MSNFLVSSLSLSSAPRSSVSRVQQDLVQAQKEVVTGRHADVGLSLGIGVGHTISLRGEVTNVESLKRTNTQLAQRFETMQTILGTVAETGQALLTSLISGGGRDVSARVNSGLAKANIGQLTGALNSSFGSRQLFSGAKTDTPPMKLDASGNGMPAAMADVKTAWDTMVTTVAGGDPSKVTKDQMETFLGAGGAFETLFNTWEGDWSTASNQQTESRIGENDIIKSSASANDAAYRDVMKSYVMMASLDVDKLGDEARQVLTSRAIDTLSGGLSKVTEIRSEIGLSQERIERSNEGLKSQKLVLDIAVGEEEGIDVYAASTRVTSLMNTLETSYSLTARIARLNLLSYL